MTTIQKYRDSIMECEAQIEDYESRIRGLKHDIQGMQNAIIRKAREQSEIVVGS